MKSSYSHLKCCLKRNPNGHNSISRNLASPRKFPQSPWPHHTNKTRQRLWTHTFFLLLYNTQEHCLSFVHCTYALDSVLSVCVNAICTKSCAQVFVSTASILPLAWAHFDVSLLCKTRRGTRDTYARHSPLGDEQRRSRRKEGRRERGWGKRVNFPAVSPLTCTKIVSLVTKGRADESPQCARYHWKRSLATS